ncbi:MAG: glycosyltransferase family 2 protein [Planctomycetes bacterium]|nr:glycosyltransferase family 2 protein [Planctomycetota bacterium]
MPCLDEADTLETCIRKAQRAIQEHNLRSEIIVADNGSTDGSRDIAEKCGAKVVYVAAKGYGHALMGGIAAAQGRYVLIADADDSYDFLETPKFLEKIREGYDLVQGCRLPEGGGVILPGAMPWSHRWIGNPLFSRLSRWWFRTPIHDIYCGMRIFTREHYKSLNQRCTGMEFATEMIVKSSLYGAKIAETPITLRPDGRTSHPPHLKTLRDGWRTLRFFMMYSPKWLFLAPGMLLVTLGLIGYGLALPAVQVGDIIFDAHTLLFASLAILCGYQAILFAIFTKTFAINEGLMPEDPRISKFFDVVNLERGLVLSAAALLVGLALLLWAVNVWRLTGFGRLDYATTMRWVIPGATLTALGFQTMLSSFFVSILGIKRR